MNAWETEDEYAAAAQASLPTPTDTPYRTPSRSSRRSSRQKSASPGPSSSPPPMLPDRHRRGSKDVTNDESISILDPRRFTPTLHANLVSEILALRRDQEERIKTIENLESDLHNFRGEHETLQETLLTTSKESRSLKRQLALLEGGTSSALSELARERDEAVEVTSELKRRLEAAQKKGRIHEDNVNRVEDLWQKDKDNWEDEKRKLERRIHVAEGRLKTVLDEVAAYQASHQNGQQESEAEEASRDPVNGQGSDAGSIRTMSMTNSIRFSTINGINGQGTKLNGMSLADELDLDDYDDQTDHDGRESVLSVLHKRNQSRESVLTKHHRRNQSNESLMRPGSVARGRLLLNQAVLDRLEGGIQEDDETISVRKVQYTDTGVQYSPPPSPKVSAEQLDSPIEPIVLRGNGFLEKIEKISDYEHPARELEVEANQRRKRVHASPQLFIEPVKAEPMVSAASQTLEDPLSPPRTPVSPTRAPPPPPINIQKELMTSTSTQTDFPVLQSPRRAAPPTPIPIPSIQLHPPSSAPATPREPLLPQHSRDAACQVSMQTPIPTRSTSVQTEEIRVDLRLNLLPPHLQPSSISSAPPSPEPTLDESKRFSPVPGNLPPRNPRRIRTSLEQGAATPSPEPQSENTRDAYPGNNDDGPLAKDKGSIRRPHRVSSLFAGFDNVSSDDGDEFADGDLSDNDFRTALSAPKPHAGSDRGGKRNSIAPTSVPENAEATDITKPLSQNTAKKSSMKHISHYDATGDYTLPEVQTMPQRASVKSVRQLDKPLSLVTTTKPATMRRTALIQSGVAAHQGRSRSPSLPEPVKEPPFPIPTRASSRQPPVSSSAPSDGTRSPTWGRGYGRGHYRAGSIRKVRSAAALPRGGRSRRHGSRSPPPMSPSTEAPESPQLPPMPNNDVTTPRYMRDTGSSRYKRHRQQPSATTANTVNTVNTNTNSVGSSNQATGVVDAIAQTMVGEWMFKYVRRRASFGVAESNIEGENGNGVRHKRWVWLAPYERAVMWSSKQPTSGPALLGKSGRKLTIQSVLDVKDDNLSPKGGPPLFNRSILILTPARALKFTAINSERHYIWLTALSFLAHSSQAVPEIVAAPLPIPKPTIPDFEPPRQGTRLRRNGIRDSIRVAKGKNAVARPGPLSVHSSQHGGDSIREAESFYSNSQIGPYAADPPIVPRFSDRGSERGSERGYFEKSIPSAAHSRKRSNTGPRMAPPLSFRGFSGPAVTLSNSSHAPSSSIAGMSVGTTGSSDIYQSQASGSVAGYTGMSVSGRSSVRTSDASARPGAVVNNFFDAVGTMRMEAFISPMAMTPFSDYPDEQDEMNMFGMHRRRSKERRRQRSRNRDSYSRYSGRSRPSEDWYGGSKTAGEEEYGQFDGSFDPFRGF
ncbi:hypothetical protein B0O99DRAFT_651608 [Bisporella sp. PMI_857]|nr:hypothetical protein B0O99DRAFT_651608 [Bisporella sp. PMI_857]